MNLQDGFQIEQWEVFPREGRMTRHGSTVRVRPKTMDVLCVLASRAGEVVERDALLTEVWGETAVTDEPLTATVGELRRILGDRRGDTRYIETIPKRGYRLLVAVQPTGSAGAAPTGDPGQSAHGPIAAQGAPPVGTGLAPAVSRPTLIALGFLGLFLAYALYSVLQRPDTEVSAQSVAVLPFAVQSDAAPDQYLGDGLAREILTILTSIDGLQVASANSSFQFRNRRGDHLAIRENLGVAAALDGDVHRVGNRVRIQVQLLDTRSGFNLWAKTYDRELTDVFTLQSEIAGAIAEHLSIRLLDPGALAAQGRSADGIAYDLYLQATHQFEQAQNQADLTAARGLFESAVARDPGFSLARVGIAEASTRLADLSFERVEPAYGRARREVQAALAVSPNLAEAYWLQGWIALYHDWDWEAALKSLQRALTLQPGNSRIIMANAAAFYHLNQLDRAVTLARRAALRDPLRAGSHYNLAYFSFAQGDLESSEAALAKTLAQAPGFAGAHLLATQIHLQRGDLAAAAASARAESHPVLSAMATALAAHAAGDDATATQVLKKLEAEHGASAAYQIADLHAYRGDIEAALAWLDRAFQQRDPGMAELLVDPLLSKLRGDPRFATLARQLGFPESSRGLPTPGAG